MACTEVHSLDWLLSIRVMPEKATGGQRQTRNPLIPRQSTRLGEIKCHRPLGIGGERHGGVLSEMPRQT